MKKTIKTALSLIIAASLLLLMASCTFSEVLQKLFVGSMDDGTADFDMGVIELGMKFTLPESWDFYDREELLQMSGLDENGDEDALKKELLQKTTVYDMFAVDSVTGMNVIVLYENIKVQGMNPETFDAQAYAAALTGNLEKQTTIQYTKSSEQTVSVGGYEFLELSYEAYYPDYDFSIGQKYYIRKIDDFIMGIIVTEGDGSFDEMSAFLFFGEMRKEKRHGAFCIREDKRPCCKQGLLS